MVEPKHRDPLSKPCLGNLGHLIETEMHSVKLLGQRLSARDFDRQVPEIHIRAAILNGSTALGIPRTEAVG